MIMRSISARDCAELCTARKTGNSLISLVSFKTSFVAAVNAASRAVALVVSFPGAGCCADAGQLSGANAAPTIRKTARSGAGHVLRTSRREAAGNLICFDILMIRSYIPLKLQR
jgi:hypothetical protein